MGFHAARRRFARNVWWSTLVGFAITLAAGFATRYSARAGFLLPYGVDDPFAPLFAIIRNSFWILVILVVVSMFRDEGSAPVAALPVFFLNLQVFGGEVIFVLLAAVWHRLGLPGESSALVVLMLSLAGQLLAYIVRLKLTRSRHHAV